MRDFGDNDNHPLFRIAEVLGYAEVTIRKHIKELGIKPSYVKGKKYYYSKEAIIAIRSNLSRPKSKMSQGMKEVKEELEDLKLQHENLRNEFDVLLSEFKVFERKAKKSFQILASKVM